MMFPSYSTAKSYPVTRWLLLSLLMTLSGGCVEQGPQPPKVIDGSIDLSQWDLEKDGSVTLKGEWHFWWEALHPAEAFVDGAMPAGAERAAVPRSWVHYDGADGTAIERPAAGYATYAIRLKLPEKRSESMSVMLGDVRDSGKIFLVNREGMVSSDESGRVGVSFDDYIPLRARMQLELSEVDGSDVTLVMQVASFVGGLAEGAVLAPVIDGKAAIAREVKSKDARALWLQGAFLIMGLYHLVMYGFRTEDKSFLWVGLALVLIFVRVWLDTGHLDRMVTAESPTYYVTRINLELLALYGTICIFILYLDLHFGTVPRWFLLASLSFSAIFSVAQLVVPAGNLLMVWPYFIPVVVFDVAGILTCLVLAGRNGSYGAISLALAICIAFVAGVHDMMVNLASISSVPILNLALLAFVLVQSVIMSRQFIINLERSQRLTLELQDERELLAFELEERTKVEGELSHVRSELTRSEELLVNAQKMASIGELVASIGHELANPIWAVGGAREQAKFGAERLRDFMKNLVGDNPSDDAKDAKSQFDTDIGEIESALGAQEVAVSQMTEISMALRKNARIERKAVPVKLAEVVSDALVLVAGKMKRFEVVTEISEVPDILGYPGKLAQVLTNLLSNAADALSDNKMGGKVRVRLAEKMSEGKAGLVVTVEDSGPGVPMELRDRVTEMFFTTKPIGVGTGLGLGISIRIVRGHGGRLTIDSSDELGGARFEVWLPLSQAQGQELS